VKLIKVRPRGVAGPGFITQTHAVNGPLGAVKITRNHPQLRRSHLGCRQLLARVELYNRMRRKSATEKHSSVTDVIG
jgi:hypothetical protein